MRDRLLGYLQPHVLVVDEVGYFTYGPDAANVLFHVVNDRHLKKRPIIFTTNKSPLTSWGAVLHDHDLAEAIVDRPLERGRLLVLDGPSYRTRHLPLDSSQSNSDHADKPARVSGKLRPKSPEPTGLFAELGASFKTTNCLESINGLVEQRTGNIDYWKNSEQKQRWLATALLDIEPRLRRVRGHQHLPALRRALQAYKKEREAERAGKPTRKKAA